VDAVGQVAGAERLGDVVLDAEGHPAQHVLLRRVLRRHHDPHRTGARILGERGDDLEGVAHRDGAVEDDKVGLERAGELERLVPVGGAGDVVAVTAELCRGGLADDGCLVGDENPQKCLPACQVTA
jgi:hypothetical protein